MKILIVSDTHGSNRNFIKVMDKLDNVDMVIHCGDLEGGEDTISEYAGCRVEMVAGNNDFFSDLPREREFQIGKYQVWLTHGHTYYVSMGNETIKKEATAKGMDIVIYGHTHKPVIDTRGEVIALNPGSLSYPRQAGRKPSYIVMELDQEENARFDIFFLEK